MSTKTLLVNSELYEASITPLKPLLTQRPLALVLLLLVLPLLLNY